MGSHHSKARYQANRFMPQNLLKLLKLVHAKPVFPALHTYLPCDPHSLCLLTSPGASPSALAPTIVWHALFYCGL